MPRFFSLLLLISFAPVLVSQTAPEAAEAYHLASILQGDTRIALLRTAAQSGHVPAALELGLALHESRSWHEAHWWLEHWLAHSPEDQDFDQKLWYAIMDTRNRTAREAGFHLLPELKPFHRRATDEENPPISQELDRDDGAALGETGPADPTALAEILQSSPTDRYAHLWLAKQDVSAQQPYRALYRLRQTIVYHPNSLRLRLAEARLLRELNADHGTIYGTRAALAELAGKYPPAARAQAWAACASLAMMEADFGQAERYLSDAQDIHPDPRFLLERAAVRARLHDYRGAIADLHTLLADATPDRAGHLQKRILQLETKARTTPAEIPLPRPTLSYDPPSLPPNP